jgi:hypothetical protein
LNTPTDSIPGAEVQPRRQDLDLDGFKTPPAKPRSWAGFVAALLAQAITLTFVVTVTILLFFAPLILWWVLSVLFNGGG